MTKPKRSRRPSDVNSLAAEIVGEASGTIEAAKEHEKNPAAVELGRLGGKKGGPARAKALSKKQRSDSAKKAAQTRWRKR